MSNQIDAVMRRTPVIPVLTIEDVRLAEPIARSLSAGGLTTLEVTLRTAAALGAIAEIAKIDGIVVGAGSVQNACDLEASVRAGASFIVSPGLTDSLTRVALARGVPFLPGVSSASDIRRGMELGLSHFKFFPAEANGGIKALKVLSASFPDCRFCPTGGITEAALADWLALDSVICVGGNWLVPENFDAIDVALRARRTTALVRSLRIR